MPEHQHDILDRDTLEFQRRYWRSTLFNETYLRNDLKSKHEDLWETDSNAFSNFKTKLTNLFKTYHGKEREMHGWSETQTINNWVKDVLNALGWDNGTLGSRKPYVEETSFTFKKRQYRTDILILDDPDEAIHITDASNSQSKIEEARELVLVPVEVKYWNRLELFRQDKIEEIDKLKPEGDNLATLEPHEQITSYMELLDKDWGILTDGATWRLFNKELSCEEPNRFYEFNLYNLFRLYLRQDGEVDRREIEKAFRYFYLFFSKEAMFPPDESDRSVPEEVLTYSKKYINYVKGNINDRFLGAMNFSCNGLYAAGKRNQENVSVEFVRDVAESCVFNILFIRSLESRGVLRLDDLAYREISLTSIIDKIDKYRPERGATYNLKCLMRAFKNSGTGGFKYDPEGEEIHKKIVHLSTVLYKGSKKAPQSYLLTGFKESVFSDNEWQFFKQNKMKNAEWVDLLFKATYTESNILGVKYQQIPYAYFTTRQLGEIYEGFLDYKIVEAESDRVFEDKEWKKADLDSEKYMYTNLPIVKKGELYFTPDNTDKKDSGTYYTPDYIVKYITEETLRPLLKGKKASDILKVNVCDAAMGSAHFLVEALEYLSKSYLEALHKESEGDLKITIPQAKRIILDKCIFGVDINPRAVKLARMSLWLKTAFIGHKLERLDDQLICGNLILEKELWDEYPGIEFSAFLQNPPYIGEKGHKYLFDPVKKGWLKESYLGKMDYFYFFMHASLRLLKDKGRAGFITTNYFPTAAGAKKLRQDLKQNCSSIDFVQLNSNKVFKSASGQHNLISILEKGTDPVKINVKHIKNYSKFGKEIFEGSIGQAQVVKGRFGKNEGFLSLGAVSSDGENFEEIIKKISHLSSGPLKKFLNVNQGIVSGADKLSDAHIRKYGIDGVKGDGIFILNKNESERKKIENKYLEPFFKNSSVNQFSTSTSTNEKIIYLDRSIESIEKNVKKHLTKYKEILANRREVKNKVMPWFDLHWPRERQIFTSEKIIVPQRSSRNTFGYNDSKWFAASDVFFITNKCQGSDLNLKAVCGLLNSKLYYTWLYFEGKRKGEALELIGEPLLGILLPQLEPAISAKLETITDTLILDNKNEAAFKKLNKLVYTLFKLEKYQINLVENFYNRKVGNLGEAINSEDEAA